MKIKCYTFFVVVGVLFAAFGFVLWFLIAKIVQNKIHDLLPLNKKTMIYEEWMNTTLPIYMQFWFFNILNKYEVEKGEKPVLQEKGPYTYREYRVKENVTFLNNGYVSYKQKRRFYFERKLSIGDENDIITTVNIPMVVIAEKFRNPSIFTKILEIILKHFGDDDSIKSISVGNLTWGYVDPMLKMLSDLAKLINHHIDPTVGLFYGKNNTDDGEYIVDSGSLSLDNFLEVKEWRGNDHLNYWNDKGANMINGTDGSMFPPFLYKLNDTSRLYVFQSDICRSIYAIHTSSSVIQGIPTQTYTPPYSVFANHSENPDNFGFCVGGVCLGSGVLNLSTCIPGMPIVMSQPQLYQAAEHYQNSIIGLHPSKDCVTTLNIEPTTGLPLNLQKKLQINIAVESVSSFSHMRNMSKMLLPIMWLNESVKIDDHLANLIKTMLIIPIKTASIVSIALMSLGSFLTVFMSLLLIIKFKQTLLFTYGVVDVSEATS